MAIWDFVKDAGKSLFGSEAEAHEAAAQGQARQGQAPRGQAPQSATDRKVATLNAELSAFGLTR